MSDLRDIPYGVALSTYIGWTIIYLVGHVRDLLAWLLFYKQRDFKPGYAPIRRDYEDFYTRRAYYRLVDCFSRPVLGPPDRVMSIALRSAPQGNSELKETGAVQSCINIGSYNYLGFASQVAFPKRWILQLFVSLQHVLWNFLSTHMYHDVHVPTFMIACVN